MNQQIAAATAHPASQHAQLTASPIIHTWAMRSGSLRHSFVWFHGTDCEGSCRGGSGVVGSDGIGMGAAAAVPAGSATGGDVVVGMSDAVDGAVVGGGVPVSMIGFGDAVSSMNSPSSDVRTVCRTTKMPSL
ncbi:hypothetical protein [Bifidobacterium biavatii]|uniref:hypothetical protein n=1 Tax=Bifidobacterium biavatii TaxID=762212 RepID=UPI000ABAF656|nr:hypothetical protein [Bifidobacterium biavatii]